MEIPCKRGHQEQLGESGMVPRYWLQVLDHLVAVIKGLAKKRGRGLRKNKCTDSVPLLRGLHIQDQFAAVEDLELF